MRSIIGLCVLATGCWGPVFETGFPDAGPIAIEARQVGSVESTDAGPEVTAPDVAPVPDAEPDAETDAGTDAAEADAGPDVSTDTMETQDVGSDVEAGPKVCLVPTISACQVCPGSDFATLACRKYIQCYQEFGCNPNTFCGSDTDGKCGINSVGQGSTLGWRLSITTYNCACQ